MTKKTWMYGLCVMAIVSATNVGAISNGNNSPDNPRQNAFVNVAGGSGILITPNLVLTNGHVIGLDDDIPASHNFSRTNRAFPDRWYADGIDGEIRVWFGRGVEARTVLQPDGLARDRQRFQIFDENGGTLESNDTIGIKTSTDHYLFVNGGRMGGMVLLDTLVDRFGPWQSMSVVKLSSGDAVIRSGDEVALRAADGSFIGTDFSLGRRNAVLTANLASATSNVPDLDQEYRFVIENEPFSSEASLNVGNVFLRQSGLFLRAPYAIGAEAASLVGYNDIALVRLSRSVPEDLAIPVRVIDEKYLLEFDTRNEFFLNKTFEVAGYGANPVFRQEATFTVQASQADRDRFAFQTRLSALGNPISPGSARPGTQQGDSGSGWVWTDPENGLRWTVAVTQQTGNNFLPLTHRGGVDASNTEKPDVYTWINFHLGRYFCMPASGAERVTFSAGVVCHFDFRNPSGDPTVRPNLAPIFSTVRTVRTSFGRPSVSGAECTSFDPDRLTINRESGVWWISEGDSQLMRAAGSGQQSYMRGQYLLQHIRSNALRELCITSAGDAYIR